MKPEKTAPIGIFDSGVGGLSVLRAIRAQLPDEAIVYFGDQRHVPYGPRPMAQVRQFSAGITNFLLSRNSKIVVVACNAASAAALTSLRREFADLPFVGMEPAVKPAAEETLTGVVGVLATPATFQGALFASVVERFAAGVQLLQSTCPGLVERIEAGDLDGPRTRSILAEALEPMLKRNIDCIVLACTHYPFVIPVIQQIVGDKVRVIDPAPAIARQTGRLLESNGLTRRGEARGDMEFFTSGGPDPMRALLPRLLGESGVVSSVSWTDGSLTLQSSQHMEWNQT